MGHTKSSLFGEHNSFCFFQGSYLKLPRLPFLVATSVSSFFMGDTKSSCFNQFLLQHYVCILQLILKVPISGATYVFAPPWVIQKVPLWITFGLQFSFYFSQVILKVPILANLSYLISFCFFTGHTKSFPFWPNVSLSQFVYTCSQLILKGSCISFWFFIGHTKKSSLNIFCPSLIFIVFTCHTILFSHILVSVLSQIILKVTILTSRPVYDSLQVILKSSHFDLQASFCFFTGHTKSSIFANT
jgi:hypothetical protein